MARIVVQPEASAAVRSFVDMAYPRSSGQRYMMSEPQKTKISPRNQTKYSPIDDCAKECTLAIAPERVRNVPKMVMKNVRQMRKTFQTFIIPRRSWIITECANAAMTRSGRKAAFSTGSQAQ